MKPAIGIVGGDLRYVYLIRSLHRAAYPVTYFGLKHPLLEQRGLPACAKQLSELANCDVVMLPTPICKNGTLFMPLTEEPTTLEQCLQALPPNALVVGGSVSPETAKAARAQGFEITDLLAWETLAVQNAIPTAEGALAIAMENTPYTISGSDCLIVGYGRIGRVLARRLTALGAKVAVAARNPNQRVWAQAEGCCGITIEELPERAPEYDLFFNTVPSMIFDGDLLQRVRPEALIIDLASQPGGVDFLSAQQNGIHAIHALALPGKVAPQTAGENMKDALEKLLQERGF